MSAIDDALQGNAQYAASFDKGDLPLPPARGLAVVACMDARLNVHGLLGISEGDAHVIRNAGGVVSDDAIRSLVISQRLLGTREILLIHHTDCGMLTFRDDDVKDGILADTGLRPSFALESFGDLEGDVRQSMARIQANPFIPHKDQVRGFVYDCATGQLNEVSAVGGRTATGVGLSSVSSCRRTLPLQDDISCAKQSAARPARHPATAGAGLFSVSSCSCCDTLPLQDDISWRNNPPFPAARPARHPATAGAGLFSVSFCSCCDTLPLQDDISWRNNPPFPAARPAASRHGGRIVFCIACSGTLATRRRIVVTVAAAWSPKMSTFAWRRKARLRHMAAYFHKATVGERAGFAQRPRVRVPRVPARMVPARPPFCGWEGMPAPHAALPLKSREQRLPYAVRRRTHKGGTSRRSRINCAESFETDLACTTLSRSLNGGSLNGAA